MIVEIAGLAGTGKTTLARRLCESYDGLFVAGNRLRATRTRNLPFILRNSVHLWPLLLGPVDRDRGLTRDEVKKLLFLNGWNRVLLRQARDTRSVIVFDQGAIFYLATLRQFGPAWLRADQYRHWWDRWYDHWAAAIDVIIWLEAPVETLMERVRNRTSWHVIKDASEDEMRTFLKTYESGYEYVLARLAQLGKTDIVRVKSGSDEKPSVDEAVFRSISRIIPR